MKNLLKNRAIILRKKGLTYSEISYHLNKKVPKGTLSGWFKTITLTSSEKLKLHKNITLKLRLAQLKSAQVTNKKRELYLMDILSGVRKYVKKLDKTTQKLILSILYLGEGAKYISTNSLRLCSSDSRIIRLYLRLLNNCYKIDPQKIRLRIQCRHDQNSKLVENYWRDVLNLPNVRFYPTYVDKRTKGKPTTKQNYYGVCTVNYFDTKIQLELEILSHLIIDTLLGNKVNNSKFVSYWLNPRSNGKISRTGS